MSEHTLSGEFNFILLSDDPDRIRQLQSKYQEYRMRVAGQRGGNKQDAVYKAALLEPLLRDGVVNPAEVGSSLLEKQGEYFDFKVFLNAYGVVKDYAETGGKNTAGGSGLPMIIDSQLRKPGAS